MPREKDILYENETHWVLRVPTGYDVYRTGTTYSTRVAQIGWPNSELGRTKAINEADRRNGLMANITIS